MKKVITIVVCIGVIVLLFSCNAVNKRNTIGAFKYETFKDSILAGMPTSSQDSINIFDSNKFIPGKDSLNTLLLRLDSLWTYDLAQLSKSSSNNTSEIAVLNENIKSIDSFLNNKNDVPASPCKGKECPLYIEVLKSKQRLYLYLDGELKDSFAVSTGINGHDTPDFSLRPTGPVLIKYTSRKFPGGNYEGLGNMPYAVFLRGGYAIHGTTQGNFSKLGSRASHGCIRLHPDNAKVFNELVKKIGLNNTWIIVR